MTTAALSVDLATASAAATDPVHSATYSPEDNKIRIYPAHRLSAEEYARVKAAGFSWAPKQEVFVAPMWTPEREDMAREFCGDIGDEDTTLTDRAEDRADRFDGYRENRKADATSARDAVARIADGIPFGQPILVGHHSERHARKDAERITEGMRRAVRMWETAEYWRSRAAGAIRHAKYKERPDVRARRIKGLESDQRKHQKNIAYAARAVEVWATLNDDSRMPCKDGTPSTFAQRALYVAGNTNLQPYGIYSSLRDGSITPEDAQRRALAAAAASRAHAERWLSHIGNRLEYERAMLAEGGGLAADKFDLQPGGTVTHRGRRSVILKVNRRDGRALSVSVTGQSGTVGLEEITDYTPPTETAAAAVAAVTKLAPLCNYDGGAGFARMTEAQYKALYEGSRLIRQLKATDTHEAHRVRHISGYKSQEFGGPAAQSWDIVPVFLIDAKVKPAPLIGGSPEPTKPRRSTARKIAESAGVDTAGQPDPAPAPDVEAVAAILADWGVSRWNDADAGRVLAAAERCGWVRRPSVTQVEWTDAGVAELRAVRGMTRDAARQVLAEATAPTRADVLAEADRLQARTEAAAERSAEGAEFDAMRQALRTGAAVQVVAAPQLFPTPADVAARMVALADLPHRDGTPPRVAEPSAGTGALLLALRNAYASTDRAAPVVHAWEIVPALAQRLRDSFPAAIVRAFDFLQFDPNPSELFDAILMNPPFKDAADVRHILHARRFLAPGGRLVAICAAGPRQHEALQPLADSWEYLPPGTFAGTGVRAVLLTMGAEG